MEKILEFAQNFFVLCMDSGYRVNSNTAVQDIIRAVDEKIGNLARTA